MSKKIKEIFTGKWLPSNWQIISRDSSEQQVGFRIGHKNPLLKMNKEYALPRSISYEEKQTRTGYAVKTVVTIGINWTEDMFHGGTKEFFDFVDSMKEVGYLKWPQEKLEKFKKEYAKLMPINHDFVSDIAVIEFQDEKAAKTELDNLIIKQTEGPFRAKVRIPGWPEGTDVMSMLNSPMFKNFLTKEQMKQLGEFKLEEFKKMAQKINKEVKADFAKRGVKVTKGKFFGGNAVFSGKGGSRICNGIQIENFLLFGGLLGQLSAQEFPAGSTVCDSLTKFYTKHVVERFNGSIEHRDEIRPHKSTIAAEGFLNKNEIEKMLKNIITITKP